MGLMWPREVPEAGIAAGDTRSPAGPGSTSRQHLPAAVIGAVLGRCAARKTGKEVNSLVRTLGAARLPSMIACIRVYPRQLNHSCHY
jgi:hypothetical protein